MASIHLTVPFFSRLQVFPSIRVFSTESVLRITWPKYWSFSFSISPSNEYSGLISFRMDWLDLLAVQGTLKSFLQHHISKAPILQHSAFFIVQLTSIHDHWKNHSFDYADLFGKVTSLLFHMLSRLVTAFIPRSKRLLMSRLQSLVRHYKQKEGQDPVFFPFRTPVRRLAPAPLFRPGVGPASIRDPTPRALAILRCEIRGAQVPFREGAAAQRQGRSGQPTSGHQPLQGQLCWWSRPSRPAHILGPSSWVLSTQPF